MTQTQTQTRQITLTQALNEAMRDEMRTDESVFIMGEDIQSGVYGASAGLFTEFGGDRGHMGGMGMGCPSERRRHWKGIVGAEYLADRWKGRD